MFSISTLETTAPRRGLAVADRSEKSPLRNCTVMADIAISGKSMESPGDVFNLEVQIEIVYHANKAVCCLGEMVEWCRRERGVKESGRRWTSTPL